VTGSGIIATSTGIRGPGMATGVSGREGRTGKGTGPRRIEPSNARRNERFRFANPPRDPRFKLKGRSTQQVNFLTELGQREQRKQQMQREQGLSDS